MEECTHMWLRISSRLGFQRDLFLCLCYIPPQTSTYYAQVAEHPLDVITREVHAAAAHGNVLLAGDFNARTGIAPDWLACPDFADLQALIEGMPTDDATVSRPPLPRHNQDSKLNAQGKALLQLCHECQLLIVNGRSRGDEEGQLTCYNHNSAGASTVDYFIADPNLLGEGITDSRVLLRPTLAEIPLSDHCPISLNMHAITPPDPPGAEAAPAHRSPRFH